MSATLVILIILGYFVLLMLISTLTKGRGDASSFFTGNRQSPWYLVAFGMVGTTLSGVTFISVPGWVESTQFTYMQMVLGNFAGFAVIALILMPLYYKLKLVSIYEYLHHRFGFWSYKSGAALFLLSRSIGAAFRLYLVALVLQIALFEELGVPFEISVFITIALIWIYTFKGGIKTIVWTDTLQTLFMLTAVGVSIVLISSEMDMSLSSISSEIIKGDHSKIFDWEWGSSKHFLKQFISGAFIAIVMIGLDQDMMQKNLTCKTLDDAQKNIFWFSIVFVLANLLFLTLGALLLMYSSAKGIPLPESMDNLFPILALEHFGLFAGVTFLLGITAAAYSSADSALTALTTSFCIDFLGHKVDTNDKKTRIIVHLGFSVLLFILIIIFKIVNDESVVSAVFKVAGYTYGPLLGLYTFGLFTKRMAMDKAIPIICILSPALSYLVDELTMGWFGFGILIVNGAITYLGIYISSFYNKEAQLKR